MFKDKQSPRVWGVEAEVSLPYNQKPDPCAWVYPGYHIQPQHGAGNRHLMLRLALRSLTGSRHRIEVSCETRRAAAKSDTKQQQLGGK
ncbi:hypothetical protein EYF80_019152 [Liparis tanakae]|uniref:Uncharacterized protein n=1 Tax=Liparis tanakae TaxID=230148 RepID=A0A4Z2HY27_9TELE|nr:hypothetical protein EYF80_019152 [Liparis tanakae]